MFAITKRHDRGQRTDSHDRCQILFCVGIDGGKNHVIEALSDIRKDWTKACAGGAPGCPKVYDHGVMLLHSLAQGGKREFPHQRLLRLGGSTPISSPTLPAGQSTKISDSKSAGSTPREYSAQ